MAKKPAKTAIELIDEAAADPDLTARAAVLNLGRLALHLGVHDAAKLHSVGSALGQIAMGIGKVAAADAAQGGGGDGGTLADFAGPLKE